MAMPERRMASRREPIGSGKLHCGRLLLFGTLGYRNCLAPVDRFLPDPCGRGIREGAGVFMPVPAQSLELFSPVGWVRSGWIGYSRTSNPCRTRALSGRSGVRTIAAFVSGLRPRTAGAPFLNALIASPTILKSARSPTADERATFYWAPIAAQTHN